ARPNAQIIFLSSPPVRAVDAPVMYRLRHRGDPTAPRSPNDGPWQQDPGLGYRDFGAGGDLEQLDDVDLDDRELWARTNPLYQIRITEETVKRERLSMSREGFARERLGIWPRKAV